MGECDVTLYSLMGHIMPFLLLLFIIFFGIDLDFCSAYVFQADVHIMYVGRPTRRLPPGGGFHVRDCLAMILFFSREELFCYHFSIQTAREV